MPKTRGQGEGSIFEESPGRWVALMNLGYEVKDGKRRRIRRKFVAATRAAVAEKLNTAIARNQNGGIVTSGKDTLADFLANWLETTQGAVRPKTYRSYEQMVRNHLSKTIPIKDWKEKGLDNVPGLGATQLRKLDATQIDRWMKAKIAAGSSPALVRYVRVVLRIALNEALRRKLVELNAATLAKPPKVPKSKVAKGFTPGESAKLFDAIREHRFEALFLVLGHGLRHNEALGLRWQDVDLEGGELHVRHQLQREKKQVMLVEPKSEESNRTVPLHPSCVESLRKHKMRQAIQKDLADGDWVEGGFVFTSNRGTPLFDRNVLRTFYGLLEIVGLPRRRIHDLRHACVSFLGAAGVPDKVIAEIVGHSDVRLTKNIYTHADKEQKKAAISNLGSLLNPMAPQLAPQKQKTRPN